MKIFFRRIHLYLGLTTGLIVMITCLTGAILVYEKELKELFNKNRYFHSNQGNALPADSLVTIAESAMKKKAVSIKLYSNPLRNAEINVPANPNKTVKIPSKRPPVETVFVNPVTGEIVEVYNSRASFFFFTMNVHRWMLSGQTGRIIVGISTLIFLFILITGIILWWPKNAAILKQRINLKWKAGFKRLNHDYHVVLGFYSSLFLFVLAFTGLAWSFQWFNDGIFKVTGTKQTRIEPLKNEVSKDAKSTLQYAYLTVKEAVPSPYYSVSLPKKPEDAYAITVLPESASMDVATEVYFVNCYTGALIGVQKFSEKNTGQKVRAAFKPVHTASIFGQFSKLIGFIVCLLGTFFPISGVIMWWNRTNKKRK